MHASQSHPDLDGHNLAGCIEACSSCHDICAQTVYQLCLPIGGKYVGAALLTLMADCAQICRTAADFMIRGSDRHLLACRLCAEICSACAEDCERVGGMDACARACRHCADCCQTMCD
ncbi:MAG TPA: four-helix bundle copper-binding protein [Lacunisphaera sp.]|nr:four-helix bundle copper-binding protein [Lacunisphaera sp.]